MNKAVFEVAREIIERRAQGVVIPDPVLVRLMLCEAYERGANDAHAARDASLYDEGYRDGSRAAVRELREMKDEWRKLGLQQVRECPCGDPICKQWVVWPAFSRPESATTDKAWCEEVVRRLNAFEEKPS